MRTPTTITLSNTVTIFTGLKKFNNTNGVNTNGLVNQTGGWLFFRTSPAVAWSSNALAFHSNTNEYQFWKGFISNIPAGNYEYYLQSDFDSGARTTYSYYTNNADGFTTTTNQATAQSSPYNFTVPKATATVTISSTNQTYNGSARPVSISTTPSGLSNTVTYNGSSSAPTNAGSYPVLATITDSNYEGSTSATLTIAKASSTILTAPTAGTITFGQTLANSSLTGGTSTPAGSFAFTLPATAPSAGTSSHGITFTLGDLTLLNGTTFNDSEATAATLQVTLNFANPNVTKLVNINFGFINTDNSPDRVASADIVQLFTPNAGNVITIDGVNYGLELSWVTLDPGAGVVSGNQFLVFEGSSAKAELQGKLVPDR
jgi:hypothetical protein